MPLLHNQPFPTVRFKITREKVAVFTALLRPTQGKRLLLVKRMGSDFTSGPEWRQDILSCLRDRNITYSCFLCQALIKLDFPIIWPD